MARRACLLYTVVTCLLAIVTIGLAHRPVSYTPDSIIYARMMLIDRQIDEQNSTAISRQFFSEQFAQQSSLLPFISAHPPKLFRDQFALFVSRPLYPYVASRFYGHLGFEAMPFVSGVAYVLTAVALFWLLSSFGESSIAAAITFAAIALPVSDPSVLELGTYALTDSLALFFSTLTLLAQVRYAVAGGKPWLVLSIAAACALNLTRPAIYLVDGPALAVFVFGLARHDRAFVRRGLTLTGIGIALSIAYEMYTYLIHAPGLTGQFAYYYERHMMTGTHKDVAPAVWYGLQLIRSVAFEIWAVANRPLALLAVTIGLMGLYLERAKVEIACVTGAFLSLPLAILTHPVPGDAGRTIEVPMIPVLAAGIVCAANGVRLAYRRQVRSRA